MREFKFKIRELTPQDKSNCFKIMLALPDYFGQEQGLLEAQQCLKTQRGLVALSDGQTIAFLTYSQIYQKSAEISWLAVLPHWHHKGVGRKLISTLEGRLKAEGLVMLGVKTLSASDSNPGSTIYASTRAFYEAIGFIPLMDLAGYWGKFTPVVFVKALQ